MSSSDQPGSSSAKPSTNRFTPNDPGTNPPPLPQLIGGIAYSGPDYDPNTPAPQGHFVPPPYPGDPSVTTPGLQAGQTTAQPSSLQQHGDPILQLATSSGSSSQGPSNQRQQGGRRAPVPELKPSRFPNDENEVNQILEAPMPELKANLPPPTEMMRDMIRILESLNVTDASFHRLILNDDNKGSSVKDLTSSSWEKAQESSNWKWYLRTYNWVRMTEESRVHLLGYLFQKKKEPRRSRAVPSSLTDAQKKEWKLECAKRWDMLMRRATMNHRNTIYYRNYVKGVTNNQAGQTTAQASSLQQHGDPNLQLPSSSGSSSQGPSNQRQQGGGRAPVQVLETSTFPNDVNQANQLLEAPIPKLRANLPTPTKMMRELKQILISLDIAFTFFQHLILNKEGNNSFIHTTPVSWDIVEQNTKRMLYVRTFNWMRMTEESRVHLLDYLYQKEEDKPRRFRRSEISDAEKKERRNRYDSLLEKAKTEHPKTIYYRNYVKGITNN